MTLTSGDEVLRVRLGAAETETAEAMRVTMEAHREENIVVESAKTVETLGLKDSGLSSLPVLPIAQSSFTSQSLSQHGSTALPENSRYETEALSFGKSSNGVFTTSAKFGGATNGTAWTHR